MYGTVARMKAKPGKEAELLKLGDQFGAQNVPGLVSEAIYRMDADSNEFIMCVAFTNKDAYLANANSAEQNARYEQFRALLAADPEWHDGEIIWSHP